MTNEEMANYYAEKAGRYSYILGALNEKIDKDLKALVDIQTDFKGDFFDMVKKRVDDLDKTRALITSELDYCKKQIEECLKKEAE